jgi:hypothetical protein
MWKLQSGTRCSVAPGKPQAFYKSGRQSRADYRRELWTALVSDAGLSCSTSALRERRYKSVTILPCRAFRAALAGGDQQKGPRQMLLVIDGAPCAA